MQIAKELTGRVLPGKLLRVGDGVFRIQFQCRQAGLQQIIAERRGVTP